MNYYQVYFPATASAFLYARSAEEARRLVQADVEHLGFERLTATADPATETLKPEPFAHIQLLQYWPTNTEDPLDDADIEVELVVEDEHP